MNKYLLSAGMFSGFLAVLIGAYGAHILKNEADPAIYNRFLTGSRYHFYHTFALVLSLVLLKGKSGMITGMLFLAGIILFSGSIYLNTIGGIASVTKVTPFGGFLLMSGWVLSGIYVLKIKE